jgi:DNA polymerase III sliding clamp (beta) subunit (PCNA family)
LKDNQVLLKSGSSRPKLPVLPEEDFVFELEKNIKGRMLKITEDLITGIEKCLISVNDNPIVEIPCGVIVKVKERKMSLYSSNDICISRYGVKEKDLKEDFTTYIPTSFCEQLVKWFKEFEEGEIEGEILFGEDSIKADFEKGYLYTKLNMEDEIIDFESVISGCKESKLDFIEIPETLDVCLERSLLFTSSELDQFVDISIEEEFMELFTDSTGGKVSDEIDLGRDIGNFKFRIDPRYIRKMLPFINSIGFTSCANTIVFIGKQDRFIHLIQSVS